MHGLPRRLVLPRRHGRARNLPVRQLLGGGRWDDGRLLPLQLRGGLLLQLCWLDELQRHGRLLHAVLRRHGLHGRRGAVDAVPGRHLLLWRRDVAELLQLPRRPAVRALRRRLGVLAVVGWAVVPPDGHKPAVPGLCYPQEWLLAAIWLQQQLHVGHRLLRRPGHHLHDLH